MFHVLGQLDDTCQKNSGKERRQPEVALQFQCSAIAIVTKALNELQ